MDGLRNTVIPFQVPSLGRMGYEQSTRQRQEQRQEERYREREARQMTKGLYGDMTKIDPEFGGRKAIQDNITKIMDLSEQYELGNTDVYDELSKLTEETKTLINMGIGATAAVVESRNQKALNPNDYATDFNRDYWTREWSAEDMMSADFQQGLVQALPQKNIPANKYVNPLDVTLYDGYIKGDEYLNVQTSRNGTTVSLDPKVKGLVKENLKTAMQLDKDLALAVFLSSAARSDENLQMGKMTQEDLKQIALRYESSPELKEQAINEYADGINERLQIMASKKSTYRPDEPKEQKGNVYRIGNRDYNTGNVSVDIVQGKIDEEIVGQIAEFTNIKEDVFTVYGKPMKVKISKLQYNQKTGKYKAFGFGYKEVPVLDEDGDPTGEVKTEASEPVEFVPTPLGVKKIDNLVGAPISNVIKGGVSSQQQTTTEQTQGEYEGEVPI